jgi:outer membrane protein TolC
MTRHRPLARWVCSGFFAIAGGLYVLGGLAQEQIQAPQAPAAEEPVIGVPLAELLDKTVAEQDKAAARLVEEALAAKQKTGTWRRLERKHLVRLPAAKAALQSLKKNLDIEISRHEAERVRRALMEAQAVFDPILDLSFFYDERDTHERTIVGQVFQGDFNAPQAGSPGPNCTPELNRLCLSGPAQEATAIIGGGGIRSILFTPRVASPEEAVFIGGRRGRVVEQPIFVSRNQPNGPTQTYTYTMALTQQLPWGPSYDVSVITTDRDVFYDNRGNSFDASWASTLVFNLIVPLPGGRNFGPYAIFDTQIKFAEKQRERGFWGLKSSINTTLLQVNLAYLNLIEALENLRITTEDRELVQHNTAHTQRLFEDGFATTFDKAQIEAELAQARAREQQAQNDFILASDLLATLIEYSDKAVRSNIYLPVGYAAWLNQPLELDAKQALAIAKEHQPDLQLSRVDYESSEILKRGAAVEARPDVTLTAQIQSIQDGSVYGYKSYWESIGAIGDPDRLDQSYAITYNYPWGNRALRARYAQAEHRVEDSVLNKRETHNAVAQGVNDALSSIQTARARLMRAEQNLNAARLAYNSLANRAAEGEINEFEVIINIQELLNAKRARIAAIVDNKRAEANLLASQGLIARHYAGIIAPTALERHRLSILSKREDLQYFLR